MDLSGSRADEYERAPKRSLYRDGISPNRSPHSTDPGGFLDFYMMKLSCRLFAAYVPKVCGCSPLSCQGGGQDKIQYGYLMPCQGMRRT